MGESKLPWRKETRKTKCGQRRRIYTFINRTAEFLAARFPPIIGRDRDSFLLSCGKASATFLRDRGQRSNEIETLMSPLKTSLHLGESRVKGRKWPRGRGWNEEYANHVEAKKFDAAFARCKLFLRDVF